MSIPSDYSLIILEWTPRVKGKLVMLPWGNREWLISIATARILIAFVACRIIFLGCPLLIQYSFRIHFEIGKFDSAWYGEWHYFVLNFQELLNCFILSIFLRNFLSIFCIRMSYKSLLKLLFCWILVSPICVLTFIWNSPGKYLWNFSWTFWYFFLQNICCELRTCLLIRNIPYVCYSGTPLPRR